jgi:hypothetical protein
MGFFSVYPVVRISLGQRINRNSDELGEYLTHILSEKLNGIM